MITNDERKVLEELKKQSGTSPEVAEKLGWSQSKVWTIFVNLCNKQLIELIEAMGHTNLGEINHRGLTAIE